MSQQKPRSHHFATRRSGWPGGDLSEIRYHADSDEVQKAHLRAWMGISLRHSGHFLVVGSGGISPRLSRARKVFVGTTIKKYTAMATSTKEIKALRNVP